MRRVILSLLTIGCLVSVNASNLQQRYEENCKYFNIKPAKMTEAELQTLVPKMDAKRTKAEEEKKEKLRKEKEAKEVEFENKIRSLAEQFCVGNKDVSEEEFMGIARSYGLVSDKLAVVAKRHQIRSGDDYAALRGAVTATGNVMTQRYGALQNIIKSLEMPSGTIQLTNSWENIFYTLEDYFYRLDTKAGLFLATHQLTSLRMSVLGDGRVDINHSLVPIGASTIIGTYNGFNVVDGSFALIVRGNQITFQKGMMHLLLFHSMINQGGDSRYAKEYFTKHGFTQNWDRVRRIVTFLEAKGL